MEQKIKNGLLLVFMGILMLPLLQHSFALFKGPELHGKFTLSPDIAFSAAKWWDGTYQEAKIEYLNDAVGLRPVMIKVNNQLNYSLFGNYPIKLAAGKDHYLYYWSFIHTYSGIDYKGWNVINTKIKKLKAVQDTLARLGKSLILVHSPCKAYYYPEYLPDGYDNKLGKATNYAFYLSAATTNGINQVDFNAWFMGMKSTTKDLLFTKQGIHWSVYGSLLAADSLNRYVERLRHIKMVHPVWTEVLHINQPRYSDDDIAQCLNLIFPYTQETFSYPVVSYPVDATMVKPKVLYIGDSFLILWIQQHFMDNTNSDWKFWYYFKDVWDINHHDDNDNTKKKLVGDDWLTGVNGADCIILMYTASNLNELGNGFIERAYDHYYPQSSAK